MTAPAQHGKCSIVGRDLQQYVHTICVLLPPLSYYEFPSIQGIISLLKYQTLGIIQDRKRN
jgi:hypothetical protein